MVRCAALSAALVLGACSSIGELQLPPPPVDGAWPQQPAPDPAGSAPVHWHSYFADPRLRILIAAALDNNRDLRIAMARVQEARAQYGYAKADRLPTINLGGSGSFSKTPGDIGATGSTISGERYDLSLSMISFEADLWGRLAGLSDAAKSNVLATQAAQKTVQIALIADVATAYFALLQLDETAALDTREQTAQLVAKGRDAGGVNEAEYQQSLGILESTRAASEALDYQRSVAFNRLQFLVGKMPANLPDGGTLAQQGLTVKLPAGLPGDVLLLRPDVIAAEYRLRAAHANVGAARAAFLPKILLTAGAGVASAGLSSLFNAGSWTFQPALSLPLFDGGRTASGRDLADARKEIAIAEYEKTIQLAFREVADLLAASSSTGRQLRAALAVESAQKFRFEMAVARAEVGLTSTLDVLDAQRELLAARQSTIQARRTQLDAAAQLYRALGGGQTETQLAQKN
ncbi:MAG: efflux transporter outer membrane subunit [Rhodoferax sp.]|nr:efflux transporter outer membrane subunit [Rhodoferax sp.]